MSLIQSLLSWLKKKDNLEVTTDTPEGLCPNCWGREEYGGKFYEAVKNHRANANEKDPEKGWIQDYADKNLAGIRLSDKGDQSVCSKCKLNYRPI